MGTGGADSKNDTPAARGRFAPDGVAPPLVRFDRVSKQFSDVPAVAEVALDIFPGEFFALLGPSGCGKTTLLRLLAGFEMPDAGRILLDGRDLAAVPPFRRPVNMMFQSYALFPHLTVEGNVAFGLKQERLPKSEIAARVAEMLALVKLEGFAKRRPDALSGGQRQRVALARSLVKRPRVLLLDEPLSNLDAKLREEMRFEIRQLQRQLRITTLYVTHDQGEALALSDLIAVMRAGTILAVGKPQEIYNRPTNRFVAEFVGLANFLDGRVVEPGGGVLGVVETVGHGPIRCTIPATLPAGATVTVSVRPEHIRLFREAPPPEAKDNILVGSVKVVSFMGEFNDCQLTVGETTFRVRTDPFLRPRRGEQVYLHLDAESCVALPREDR